MSSPLEPPPTDEGDFRRGNINFDFLPETHHRRRAAPEGDRRGGRRRGKRGLFNRGRPLRPVSTWTTLLWSVGALASVACVAFLGFWNGPPARILFVPIPLISASWCLMMLLLLRARPS